MAWRCALVQDFSPVRGLVAHFIRRQFDMGKLIGVLVM
jgi:hypothetical protein